MTASPRRHQLRQDCAHAVELVDGMPDPVGDLTDHLHGLAGAIGQCRISRVLRVGHVGVIFQNALRLDDVDASAPGAECHLRRPRRRIECAGHVHMVRDPPFLEVRPVARNQQLTDPQVGLGAVQQCPGFMGHKGFGAFAMIVPRSCQ